MKETEMPEWFRDSLTRVSGGAFTGRLNEDAAKQLAKLSRELGWSQARVLRVLVNKGLRDLGRI